MGSKAHFWRTMTSRVWNKSLVCDTGNVKPKSYIWILNTFNRNNVHSYRTFFVTESSDRLWCSKIYAYDITLSPFQNQEFLEPSQLYICSTGYAFVNNVYDSMFANYQYIFLKILHEWTITWHKYPVFRVAENFWWYSQIRRVKEMDFLRLFYTSKFITNHTLVNRTSCMDYCEQQNAIKGCHSNASRKKFIRF